MTKPFTAAIVLLVFGVYSIWVVASYGYFGFLSLAGREPWAMQMLLDLVIACSFGVGWMIGDAKKRGIATWPFIIATIVLGSIGVLRTSCGATCWRARRPRCTVREPRVAPHVGARRVSSDHKTVADPRALLRPRRDLHL